MKNLHKEFVRLGRERNRITYKLLALLPKIDELKIYEQQGYANVYDYAARIAGLSPGVVNKALNLEKKIQNMPHLKKIVETQGINKVGIVVGLATRENEKELAEKVEHMSKPALQEYSKEIRGKVSTSWQVELDEKMMFMLLKLKKKFGKNLSNKECLRRILEKMQEKQKKPEKLEIPGKQEKAKKLERREKLVAMQKSAKLMMKAKPLKALKLLPQIKIQKMMKIPGEKASRYISVHLKNELSDRCSHPGCCRPAEVIHHPDRFSKCHNHKDLKPLCKSHHEFAHNGISEPMYSVDYKYRKHRQVALL